MRVKISTQDLREPLTWVSRLVTNKPVMPALTFLKVTAADGQVKLEASDGDQWGHAVCDAAVEEPGSVLMPGRLFSQVVSKLPDGVLALEVDGPQHISVTSGKSEYRLRTGPLADYPDLEVPDDMAELSVSTGLFARLVTQVTRAASADTARPILTGALIKVEDGRLRAVATDSYRLATKSVECDVDGSADFESVTVPATALIEAEKAVSSDAVTVRIGLADDRLVLTTGDRVLSTNLIDGQYPNYKKLLPDPETSTGSFVVDREDFLDVLGRVAVVTAGAANTPVTLRLDPSASTLDVVAGNRELGDAHETVRAVSDDLVDTFEIAFNPAYAQDAVTAFGTEQVRFFVNDGLKPALVVGETDDDDYDDDYVHLLMPMRV